MARTLPHLALIVSLALPSVGTLVTTRPPYVPV